jgi:PGF-CTERM protein
VTDSATFNLEDGDYSIEASAEGYGAVGEEVTIAGEDATATLELSELGDADASFDQSIYQEHAGDTAEFTVELENTDSGTVTIEESDDNYEATLEVEDGNDDGEVTVLFNTYLAGSGEDGTFSTVDDNDSVTVVDENAEFDYEDGERLLPASFNMQLFVNDDNRVDVATLNLSHGSIDSVTSGTAPSDADLDDVEDITDAATASNEIAEGDNVLFSFEASGVFGAIEAGNFEEYFNLVLEQTNNQYDDGTELDPDDDYRLVEDAENDRFFVVLTMDDLEAGDEYELRLEPAVDEEGNIDSLYFIDDEEYKKGVDVIVSTQFSVVERTVEFDGMDKEDVLRVPISEDATISGETTVAPGSEISVEIDGDGFLMTDTVEVDENGTFTATFDTSQQEAGQEFEVTAEILQLDDDVSTTVDAIFVDDEKKDKEDEKKDDEKKDDEKKDDEKKDDDVKDDYAMDDDDATDDEMFGDDAVDADDDDDEPGAPADDQPGFGIAVALLALLAAAGFALRRQ